MKVMILATGKTEEYERCYAARLIEQGRAVLPPVKSTAKPPARKTRKAPATDKEAELDKE